MKPKNKLRVKMHIKEKKKEQSYKIQDEWLAYFKKLFERCYQNDIKPQKNHKA